MTRRPAVIALLVLLLLLPGCGIFGLALDILNTVLDILCFWAAPAPPDASPLPTAADGPLTLSEALEVAAAEGLGGETWLVPADRLPGFDPGPPPVPGAILRSIPIRATR
jgi:hypothetical protein